MDGLMVTCPKCGKHWNNVFMDGHDTCTKCMRAIAVGDVEPDPEPNYDADPDPEKYEIDHDPDRAYGGY